MTWRVDWATIIFFVFLFIIVGGLEHTGVLDDIAHWIGQTAGGNPVIAMTLILWIAAIVSAIIDNVPFAAIMAPVLGELYEDVGLDKVDNLACTLAIGADVGGNGTPIGASANVVGMGLADKAGKHITWLEYCKVAMPAMLICVAVANVMLYFMYFY